MKKLLIFILTAALVVALCMAVLTAADAWAADDVHMVALDDGEAIEGEAGTGKPVLPDTNNTKPEPVGGPPDGAEYLGEYYITGYAIWCSHCQGPWVGMSASGMELVPGYSVAMCSDFPFGTKIYIEGLGIFECMDRGGAIGPGRIDVACVDHAQCSEYTGHYDVWVIDDE